MKKPARIKTNWGPNKQLTAWALWNARNKKRLIDGPCTEFLLAQYPGQILDVGGADYLQDRSGNEYHAEITAGTAYPDLTIKLPAAPALIAADTEEVFFTSGVPQEVDLSTVVSDDFMRIGSKRMVLLSAAQTGACLAKTDKYVGD